MLNHEEIIQDILDIFEEWKDEFMEIEIDLAIPGKGDRVIDVYSPMKEDKNKYPLFGGYSVDDKIFNYLEKKKKIYYSINIGYKDCLEVLKRIQNVRYLNDVDWNNEDIKYLYDITKKCADGIFHRLNNISKMD